ncbi:galactosyl transferase GMA12/MNN10 family protein [Mycena rebaudengoi]|nr:galactosyl transferase GMA12/MNN10 family protein [Mycena rebaudengoi]
MHGYHHFIDRERLVDEVFNPNPPWGAWSKPAYVLSLLLTELAKPPEERLEWLFWFDADTIIANPTDPARVMDGINDGIFAIRVHRWSVELISAVVAYPTYFPQNVTASRRSTLTGPDAPARWFNALPFNNPVVPKDNNRGILASEMTPERFDSGTTDVYQDGSNPIVINPWKVMRGDLVVHFAGAGGNRKSWMTPWLERVEADNPEWADVGAKRRPGD